MAGYIGVSSKARKIKNIYLGVSNKARKVKKGYIGVNGVARQFYSSGISKATLLTGGATLPAVKMGGAAAAVEDKYALFGGGESGSSNYSSTVYGYDSDLVAYTAEPLRDKVCDNGAASVGSYAVFAGGENSSSGNSVTTCVYDDMLTRSTTTALYDSANRSNVSGCSTEKYAFFGGGQYVDVYDAQLVRSRPTKFTKAGTATSATAGNYVVFWQYNLNAANMQIYDADTLVQVANSLQIPYAQRNASGACCHGEKGLFGKSLSNVYVMDENLVMTTQNIGTGFFEFAVGHPEGYALAVSTISSKGNNTITGIDGDFNTETFSAAMAASDGIMSIRMGDYLFFAGGNSPNGASKKVTAFQLS